jgi:hypothetical protein
MTGEAPANPVPAVPPAPDAAPGAPHGPSPRVIDVHIEEVVLHGFRPQDGHGIGDALERELARLLSEPHARAGLAEGRDLPSVDAGRVSLQPGAPADAIGRRLAGVVSGGLRL